MQRVRAIRACAESCARQLTAWGASVEDSPVQGKRHLTAAGKTRRAVTRSAIDFRRQFLASLTPDHPLYDSPDALAARNAGNPPS